MKEINPRFLCANGVSLSVQASGFHYSTPREDTGPYTHVEVGFLRDGDGDAMTPPDAWREYADGAFPSDVYGYVPLSLVEEFVNQNGGFKDGQKLLN